MQIISQEGFDVKSNSKILSLWIHKKGQQKKQNKKK